MLATAEEEDQRDQCIEDITGKEPPWSAVRQSREQELKYLRDFGVYEKVDERDAIARYQVTPVDTRWTDTNQAFEPRSRVATREFKKWRSARSVRRSSFFLEALNVIISSAATHNQTFSIMHIDVLRVCVHARMRLPVGDKRSVDVGKFWIVEEEHVA